MNKQAVIGVIGGGISKKLMECLNEQETDRGNPMTKDQILSMQGRELENAVGKYVLGLIIENNWYYVEGTPTSSVQTKAKLPRYSRDMSVVWEVAERMHKDDKWNLAIEYFKHEKEWVADFDELGVTSIGVGKTAPEAICKAALLAVMGL